MVSVSTKDGRTYNVSAVSDRLMLVDDGRVTALAIVATDDGCIKVIGSDRQGIRYSVVAQYRTTLSAVANDKNLVEKIIKSTIK